MDTIRTLSMDGVQKANSGHPGTPMALAPVAYVLYTRVMRHSPRHPNWPDRDRFVLSCGHASMLLYSTLYLAGYDVSLENDLEQFRQLGSMAAGHPEYGDLPGHRGDDRPARAGHLPRGRDGAGRADARGPLQPPRPRDRRSPHVRDRLRRRPRGGDLRRGVLARRPPRPRPADLVLRPEPHLDRGRHQARVHRGRRQALRGLRLARPGPRGGHRARQPRAARSRPRSPSRTSRR